MSEIGTPAELRLGQKPGPLSLRGLGWTGQRPVPTQLLLGFGFLLVAVGGFDGRTDAGQHLLGWLSIGTVGLQFQILVESFGGALGCDHLVALQGCFANHVHTQPVVRVRLVGIGSDDLLEAVDRIINFARVGLYGTLVEIEHGGARRIELGSLIIISGSHGLAGDSQLLVETLDTGVFFGNLGLLFLLLLELFRRDALTLRGARLFLLQIEVQDVGFLVQSDGNIGEMKHLCSILDKGHVVLSRSDAQREEFTLVIGLQGILASGLHAAILDRGASNRFALHVRAYAFNRAGSLRKDRRQAEHRDHRGQYKKDELTFHNFLPANPRISELFSAQPLRTADSRYGIGSLAPAS